MPERNISEEDQRKFWKTNTFFVGCVLGTLAVCLVDGYMNITDAKKLWDELNAKFSASDAGSELYIIQSFLNYKMVGSRFVVEQAHET